MDLLNSVSGYGLVKGDVMMHSFNVATLFVVVCLVGVEFSVSAFVNPAAWRLDDDSQLRLLSRIALVLGTVMPIWYPFCGLLMGIETWLHWNGLGRAVLLAADAIWAAASVASILLLVPLNTRVAKGASDWKGLHRKWDRRHRVRVVALAFSSVLLGYVLVR